MKALITGASSGIGYETAKYLAKKGIDLILVARREKPLLELKNKLDVNVRVITMDIGIRENCYKLYDMTKDEDIDILVNNAGFGIFGSFEDIPFEKELNMIDVNVTANYLLCKLFLKDFIKKDRGYILNVASSAGLMPGGGLLSAYYATKAFVASLTNGIYTELKNKNSNVKISMLCPGPVATEFNKVANAKFAMKGMDSSAVAKYAVEKMFKGKLIIIPGTMMKILCFLSKISPTKLALQICYNFQCKKK